MKIVKEYPPNMEEIKKAFDIDFNLYKPVFAYGDKLYNPFNIPVDIFLLTHEMTHQKQQGDDPEGWWRQYCRDFGFRLIQEMEAYRVQYRLFCSQFKDRNKQARYADSIARNVSGKMYGNVISYVEALNILKKGKL
jgi:hypothetical protein